MKKRIALLIVSLMFAVMLTACSSARSAAEQAPADPPPAIYFDTVEEAVERIEQLEKDKKSLMNRCYVHTAGIMCIYCGFKEDCEYGTPKNEEPKRKVRNRSNIFR